LEKPPDSSKNMPRYLNSGTVSKFSNPDEKQFQEMSENILFHKRLIQPKYTYQLVTSLRKMIEEFGS